MNQIIKLNVQYHLQVQPQKTPIYTSSNIDNECQSKLPQFGCDITNSQFCNLIDDNSPSICTYDISSICGLGPGMPCCLIPGPDGSLLPSCDSDMESAQCFVQTSELIENTFGNTGICINSNENGDPICGNKNQPCCPIGERQECFEDAGLRCTITIVETFGVVVKTALCLPQQNKLSHDLQNLHFG